METRPPTVTRILVAIGFALSCFALALFLWIAFGGPLPAEAGGLSVHGPVQGGDPARRPVRRADLGRLRRQGEVDQPRRQRARRRDDRDGQPVRAGPRRHPGDPAPEDAARRDLRRADPGQPRAAPTLPEGGDAARARRSPRRSSSTRSSGPSTPAPAQAFRVWMQGSAAALNRPRAPTSRRRSPSSTRSPSRPTGVLRILDSQQHAVRSLVRSGGDVFHALSERKGQLRGLIQNSNTRLPDHGAPQRRPRADVPDPADLPARVAGDARPPRQLRRQHRSAGPPAPARRQAAQPDPDRGRQGRRRTSGVLRRPAGDDQHAATPASRRCAVCSATTSHRSSRGSDPMSAATAPFLAQLNSDRRGPQHVQARDRRLRRQCSVGDQSPAGVPGEQHGVKQSRTTSPLNPETLALLRTAAESHTAPTPTSSRSATTRSDRPPDVRQHAVLARSERDPAAPVPRSPRPQLHSALRTRPRAPGPRRSLRQRPLRPGQELRAGPTPATPRPRPAPPCRSRASFSSIGKSPQASSVPARSRRQP